jgi:acetyl-CoA carboxylase biotin carboxylase subunit
MATLKRKIKKLAIANRGEVAVRIHMAANELGIATVLLHSEADIQSKAFRICDETVCIGASPIGESYLNMNRVIQGALSKNCDAIHPGFGFLSENSEFAQMCLDNGISFVGPSPSAIKLMGDKISARECATQAGVPVVPGYDGENQTEEVLLKEAKKIGFPLIIKASAGGGGRGLKISKSENDFSDQLSSSKRESKSAFGSDKVFLEKYLDHAKHIEFQIFGDASGKVFHLYDRECSVQRRHQKIIEEATSPLLTKDIRQKMADCAVKIAQKVGYQSAGTVEFIYQDHEFYFMEMNTRLQVEHPVTECVTGLDLVKAQLKCAQGESLNWKQEEIAPHGHSIECRLYAEDPYQNGIPSVGLIGSCHFPDGPGRRFEVGFEKGDTITSFYDSMIAKIIVWDENREKAIDKMIKTLESTIIFGLQTNIPYLIEILNHSEFRSGEMTTQFISKYFSEALPPLELAEEEKEFAKRASQLLSAAQTVQGSEQVMSSPWASYWRGV